jgi:hypothetical protein
MKYKLKCNSCGATCWVRGSFDCPETGAVDLNEANPRDWEPESACDHDDYDIIDSETVDFDD